MKDTKFKLIVPGDRCFLQVMKKKYRVSGSGFFYDITLRMEYMDPYIAAAYPRPAPYLYDLKGLSSINPALEMLGYETLSEEDERTLLEFVGTRNPLSDENDPTAMSVGIILFWRPDHIEIIPTVDVETHKYRDDSIEASSFKEILEKIEEQKNPQQ